MADKVAAGYSVDERDASVEATYPFVRDFEGQRVTAFVSRNRDELAREFFDWKSRQQEPAQRFHDALLWWEEERFGRQLEGAAHGMMWYLVKRLSSHGEIPDKHWPSAALQAEVEAAVTFTTTREEGEASDVWIDRVAVATGMLKPSPGGKRPVVRSMPDAPEVREPYKESPEGAPAWAKPVRKIDGEREPGDDTDDDPWLEHANG